MSELMLHSKRSWGLSLVVFVSIFQVSFAQDLANLNERLQNLVLSDSLGTFWGGIVVSKNGEMVAVYTNGVADKRLQRIDTTTLFDIGSVAKHYTAAAILRLQQDGQLSVDDKISKFFDVKGKADSITIHHLASHTSGLDDRVCLQPLNFPDRDKAVHIAMNSKLLSSPGDSFRYSNAGYVVLAAIIEKVTKGSFEEYMRGTIFRLAGLKSTGFLDGVGLDEALQTARVVKSGMGGKAQVQTCFTSKTGEPWAWGLRGAGGVVTSLEDLVLWNDALDGNRLLNADSRSAMLTTVKGEYGYGLEVTKSDAGRLRVSHSGGTRGYNSQIVSYPTEGIFVGCMTNAETNPVNLVKRVEELVFPEEAPRISGRVNVSGVEIGTYHQVNERIDWEAVPLQNEVLLKLISKDKGEPRLELRMTRPIVRKLLASATSALSGRNLEEGNSSIGIMTVMGQADEQGWMEAFSPNAQVNINVLPSYNNGADPRATFVIVDADEGRWPVIVKMSALSTKALQESLEQALK